jgi:hypothetical protein
MSTRGRRRGEGVVEYVPLSEKPSGPWRIERYTDFMRFFGIGEDTLPKFHHWADTNRDGATGWAFTKLFYGVRPMFPDANTDAKYLRVWPLDEIAEEYMVETEAIEKSMELLRSFWNQERASYSSEKAKDEERLAAILEEPEKVDEVQPEIPLGPPPDPSKALETCSRFGFMKEIFQLEGRSKEAQEAEIAWLAGRLVELERVFKEPMAAGLARQALLNEMHMRRADEKLATTPVESRRFWELQDTKLKLESIYQKQMDRVSELVPSYKSATHKAQVQGLFSEIYSGYIDFIKNGNNDVLDGIFNSYEIQVLNRTSQEHVEAGIYSRYSPAWVAAVNDSKRGLWDPKWKPKLDKNLLKKMQAGWDEVMARIVAHESLPKLIRDDERGEYPPLFKGSNGEEPDENIPPSL